MNVIVLSKGELTEREAEVLKCMASGLSDKHIALMLKVSEKTIAAHCNAIYLKMQASRDEGNARVTAVSRAVARKFIEITEGD